MRRTGFHSSELMTLSFVAAVLSSVAEGRYYLGYASNRNSISMYGESNLCNDNVDCPVTGCCLMTGVENGKPTGVCQAIRGYGESCAVGNRMRDFYGFKVFTFSCPCGDKMECRARRKRFDKGVSLITDPTCLLPNDDVDEFWASGKRRPPNTDAIASVPVE
ncbi:unnamed protein product [Notodromas monacha]|uniref:Prokineticin domain-containing protein n=1 Tax=Notodromas monacha TaxID=399045 RepID=A0A7R9GED7_9CRUS|nr:unnamed protein product [Notodromas monacha]CAG0919510.1 unnamed protein product [Notodromas monacha]